MVRRPFDARPSRRHAHRVQLRRSGSKGYAPVEATSSACYATSANLSNRDARSSDPGHARRRVIRRTLDFDAQDALAFLDELPRRLLPLAALHWVRAALAHSEHRYRGDAMKTPLPSSTRQEAVVRGLLLQRILFVPAFCANLGSFMLAGPRTLGLERS